MFDLKKYIIRAFGVCFLTLLLIPQAEVVAANSAKLAIYIHKNTISGSVWDDYSNQIKLSYKGISISDVSKQLYPYGASYRTTNKRCNGDKQCVIGGTGPLCVNTDDCENPVALQEGVIVLDNITKGTYTVSIDRDGNNIRRYQQDALSSTGNISAYDCAEGSQCERTITVTDEDVTRGKTIRVDLVIIPVPGQSISRPQEDPLTAGENAEYNELVTFIGRFSIRVQNLLNWTLRISQESFTNPTIEKVYGKILNIVNGFFIIALLAIAFMWNMVIIISRRYLRRIMIMFVFAVILVNFALPINRLVINVTNILQNSFLVKDILSNDGVVKQKITANDILAVSDADYGAFVGLSKSDYLSKTYPSDGTPSSFPKDDETLLATFQNVPDLYINRNTEPIYFNIALVIIGTVGQLLLTLILVFRIIILWFFLILSPFLFILILFKFLKQFFKYWSWLYMRWLFIGPLMGICLFIIVNIWSLTGVPLESTYAPPASLWFQNATNLYLLAPGVSSGFLNTPREVMKYISALMMLYMSIILPFWLTRRFEIMDFMDKTPFSKVKGMIKTKTSPQKPPESPLMPQITLEPNVLPDLNISKNIQTDAPLTPPAMTIDQVIAETATIGSIQAEQVQADAANIAEATVDTVGSVDISQANVDQMTTEKVETNQSTIDRVERVETIRTNEKESIQTENKERDRMKQTMMATDGRIDAVKNMEQKEHSQQQVDQTAQKETISTIQNQEAVSSQSAVQEDVNTAFLSSEEQPFALAEEEIHALAEGQKESVHAESGTEEEDILFAQRQTKTESKTMSASLEDEEDDAQDLGQDLASRQESRAAARFERHREEPMNEVDNSFSPISSSYKNTEEVEEKSSPLTTDSKVSGESVVHNQQTAMNITNIDSDSADGQKVRLDQTISFEESHRRADRERRNIEQLGFDEEKKPMLEAGEKKDEEDRLDRKIVKEGDTRSGNRSQRRRAIDDETTPSV